MKKRLLARELRRRLRRTDLLDLSDPNINAVLADDDFVIHAYNSCSDCGGALLDDATVVQLMARAEGVEQFLDMMEAEMERRGNACVDRGEGQDGKE